MSTFNDDVVSFGRCSGTMTMTEKIVESDVCYIMIEDHSSIKMKASMSSRLLANNRTKSSAFFGSYHISKAYFILILYTTEWVWVWLNECDWMSLIEWLQIQERWLWSVIDQEKKVL